VAASYTPNRKKQTKQNSSREDTVLREDGMRGGRFPKVDDATVLPTGFAHPSK
jgi:hypothetical protein